MKLLRRGTVLIKQQSQDLNDIKGANPKTFVQKSYDFGNSINNENPEDKFRRISD